MYNLENLNDHEFEQLAKDIMEKMIGTKLHRFKKGRDGGVDLCDSNNSINHMIQVKHYLNSKWSDLRNSLRDEIPKVKKNNPQNYYIFCSIELSVQNKREIVNMFPNHAHNISHIIDKIEINDFLSNPINKNIIDKHFKLWFYSADLLSKINQKHYFIDSEELLFDIDEHVKRFVKTNAYIDCLKKLSESNVLLITGSPGVGKTTISKMLVLYYISKGYSVRYVSNNSIKDLKNTLSYSPENKEIILLDDFLGQHYLNIRESTSNEIKALITYIENSASKKIILNSRITIMNEAEHSFIDFQRLMQMQKINQYIIDLDKMSYLEKAKILYNHLFFSNMSPSYFKVLKTNRAYEKIIRHKNYNPRITEYITNYYNLKGIELSEYLIFIIEKLDNPDEVWDDEFRNRISEVDRIFMHTLYSLTDTTVSMDIFRKAFDKRIYEDNIKTTQNLFDDVSKRLGNSLIRISINKTSKTPYLEVSVVNPSINDYMKKRISGNHNEQKSIVKFAKFIQQVDKIMSVNTDDAKSFFNHSEVRLDSINRITDYYYLSHIVKYNIFDLSYQNTIEEAFKNLCINSSSLNEGLLVDLVEHKIVDFYNLESILLKNLDTAVKFFPFGSFKVIYLWLANKNKSISEDVKHIFRKHFKNAIEETVSEDINDELPSIVTNSIGDSELNVESYEDIEQTYIDYYYQDIEKIIKEKIDEYAVKLLNDSPLSISKSNIDFSYIFYSGDIDGSIKAHVKEIYEQYNDHDNYDQQYAEKEEWDIIHDLFSE